MWGVVGVEAEFSNLATRSSVVGGVNGVFEQKLREATRRIDFATL